VGRNLTIAALFNATLFLPHFPKQNNLSTNDVPQKPNLITSLSEVK
jgi:hypothetical protein